MLMDGMNIGRAVRVLRSRAGLSQGEVARRAGWERSYMSEFEHGKVKNPTLDTIVRFIKAVDANCDEFIALAIGESGSSSIGINDYLALRQHKKNKKMSGSEEPNNGPAASE